LSLEIADGETCVLLGSSGCGKTTTLKMINRLLDSTSGTIEVDGRNIMEFDLVELRRSMGYVFQGIGLFPHMTVQENVAIILRMLGWSARQKRQRAAELLELVGLAPDEYEHRLPEQLSGGRQQRVGVARALTADPDHLLMDEPLGALDALTRDTLQQQLLSLKTRLRKTIVFVTHDIFEALTLGARIAVLHEGRLQQVRSPDQLIAYPATPFVRELFARPAKQLAAFREVR
jgi:osmoprotectant transport system ATP-binding protein